MKQTGKKTKAPRAWTAEALLQQMSAMKTVLGGVPVDVKNLGNQCLLLSKILDSLVANNEKPSWRQELLTLVKQAYLKNMDEECARLQKHISVANSSMYQVCKYKDNAEARPSLLVLLLSVKSAFRTGWLHAWMQVPEIDEVFGTLKALFDNFTTPYEDKVAQPTRQYLLSGGAAVPNPGDLTDFFSRVSHRYYPRLKIISGFAALEAKAGYEVLMCDFHVPHMNLSERVRLYVACRDIVETSACLVTPPQVNFLVNGKQVEKRVSVGYVDGGPQMPTDVTRLVKVGANILQVVGEFSCPYVIAVASATDIPISAANSQLQDYVPPTTKTSNEVDAMEVDDEVVEGASRVSLRCPVSHQRLATPVKAASCRHLQCFDYDSFLEINEKRPAWRCPCCNRSISWPELQIDRQMEKVLKEADEKVVEVIISQDGLWEAALSVEDKGASSTDVAGTIDTIENGRDVIDLSNVDNEEMNEERYIDIQLPERKPDVRFLQAVFGNRERTSTSPVPTVMVQQENSRRNVNERSAHLESNIVPDITATALQSTLGTTGPLWSVPNRNVGAFLNVNDSTVVGARSPSMERPGQSQAGQQPAIVQALPAPSQMSQFLNLHSRTNVHPSSPGGPLNSLASSSGPPFPTHMQQQQNTFSSEAGLLIQNPTGVHMWQRHVGQQVPSMAQDFGQARQQWGGPHPQQRQTGPLQQTLSNAVQPQSLEQLLANQGHFSFPQQAHSPRSASQQQPGVRVASSSGWPSGSPNVGSVLGPGPGSPAIPEQSWRPAARMRGSITPPGIGRGVGPSSPVHMRPSGGTQTGNVPGVSGVSPSLVVSGAYAGGSITRPPLQGTTGNAWVSTGVEEKLFMMASLLELQALAPILKRDRGRGTSALLGRLSAA